MKKIIYISLLLCLSLTATAQDDIRAAFPRASDTKERAAAFYEMMSRKSAREPLVQAYLGAAQMIYAKYFTKNRQEYLRRGTENIEAAIRQSPQSIEIRMIRLSIQENLPKIVPYHRNIAEDKRFILDHIDSQDDILKEYIQKGENGNNQGMFRKRWDDHNYHEEGGESIAMVQKRNMRALTEILRNNIDKEVVVGTHGTALSTILNFYDKSFSCVDF